ncbi:MULTISPECIES: hypothetical protein [unclassified Lentimonas]|uniref:hypothetical protein n=1 Tax=unclassified Lentimonas TaxID=2630993 RepID=UPI0013896B3F|nr:MULTISPECIES: hypothetical protein [unclassified Lentimonas]
MKSLYFSISLLAILSATQTHAQLHFENGRTPVVDFTTSINQVNNSAYAGRGRSESMKPGQLGDQFWAANDNGFVSSNISGSYAAGIITAGETDRIKGGFYAAEPTHPGNRAFAYCPANDRVEAFEFRIKFLEDTDQCFVSFDAFLLQQTDRRRVGWEVSYAIDPQGLATTVDEMDTLNFKKLPSLDILNTEPSELHKWTTLGNLEGHIKEQLKADDDLILRFRQVSLMGIGGKRTVVAIDNLQAYQDIPEPAAYALLMGLLGLSLHCFKRRRHIAAAT